MDIIQFFAILSKKGENINQLELVTFIKFSGGNFWVREDYWILKQFVKTKEGATAFLH